MTNEDFVYRADVHVWMTEFCFFAVRVHLDFSAFSCAFSNITVQNAAWVFLSGKDEGVPGVL